MAAIVRAAPRGSCRGLLALALLAAGGCSGAGAGAAASATSEAAAGGSVGTSVEVTDARVQLLPGMAAAYLTIVNHGDNADRLLRVTTPDAARAELHKTVDDGGVLRMVSFGHGLPIPAHTRVVLEPGGKHIMLAAPAPRQPGVFHLALELEGSGSIEVAAAVENAAGGPVASGESTSGGMAGR